jgi:Tfp pilus assembly protein PilN
MRSVEINLAGRPFRNDGPALTALIVLVLGALVFTGYNGYTYFTADSRLEQLDQQLADHQRKMQEFQQEAERLREELKKVDMTTLEPQAAFVNGVLRERNFSWTRLFNAFEDVLPWNVQLVSVRPSFNQGDVNIQIDAIAQNHEAYLGLQTVLHQSDVFDKVVPGGYETEQGGSQRVFFDMTFRYRPAVVPEEPVQVEEVEAPEEEVPAEPEIGEESPAETASVDEGPAPAGGAS